MFQADYAVTGVRYSSDRAEISELEVRACQAADLGPAQMQKRSVVIASIESGTRYVTATRSGGRWVKGATVEVVVVKGQKYLRTDRNQVERDNLENLPEV